jgi:hypothetical protein
MMLAQTHGSVRERREISRPLYAKCRRTRALATGEAGHADTNLLRSYLRVRGPDRVNDAGWADGRKEATWTSAT